MKRRIRKAAQAAAVYTAAKTEDFSKDTARKLSIFADVFMRELEEKERPGVEDLKRMGEDLDRMGKRPSVYSRGKVVCVDENSFYEIAGEAIEDYTRCMEREVGPEVAEEVWKNAMDLIPFIKNAMFKRRNCRSSGCGK